MTDYLAQDPIQKGPFEATWESLRKYQCPEWFRDAKFGIWSHWGPQSVPMYGDWYARHMYQEGHAQYLHHWRMYGHPSKNGWKDVVPLWKAERFDPGALMQLYVDAGAKYFVAQAVHHDNFDNWASRHNRWNSTKVGPMKDIVGLWRQAAQRQGLRFGLSEHLGASFNWFEQSKHADTWGPYAGVPYDGNDPAFESLYHANRGYPIMVDGKWLWYTTNTEFHKHWFKRIKDVVDQHQPDLLYSDGGVPFYRLHEGVNCPEPGLSLIAHLYNLSAAAHGGVTQAVYNQKDVEPNIASVGVLDVERGQMNETPAFPWQTDTCVGGWFYDVRQVYKTPAHVIQMLVDIVSKNGNLLLNFTQKPDGTLDEECLNILRQLAAWMKVNGEGIYGTRPWKCNGEGPTAMKHGAFKEEALEWSTADFRFTSKGKCVYAFQMKYPQQRQAFIRSLGLNGGLKVKAVRLLGHDAPIQSHQAEDGLVVQLADKQVCETMPCIKVELA